MNEKYFRKENELDLDYAMRLIEIKKEEHPDDLDWSDIVDLLGLDLNKDSLRKSQDTIFGGISVYKQMKNRNFTNNDKEIEIQLEELKKERIKLSDERASLNRRLRDQARNENINDLIKENIKKVDKFEFLSQLVGREISDNVENAGILTLSDWHYGLEINEFNNQYNPSIARKRISNLTAKVIEYIIKNEITTLYVLGLGDFCSGIIHTITRIDNRENIVEQVVNVSEILAGMLVELGKYAEIYYYDVNDNHGRIFPNKDDWKNEENFSLFIKWYLIAKFKDIDTIHIMENQFNEEIGTVEILGKNYAFVHGHRDRIDNVVQNLSLMTKKFYEAIFIGHLHHFAGDETHCTYVYMNGTLSGTDQYANNVRKTSNPSQNFFVVDRNGIVCQYLIKL